MAYVFPIVTLIIALVALGLAIYFAVARRQPSTPRSNDLVLAGGPAGPITALQHVTASAEKLDSSNNDSNAITLTFTDEQVAAIEAMVKDTHGAVLDITYSVEDTSVYDMGPRGDHMKRYYPSWKSNKGDVYATLNLTSTTNKSHKILDNAHVERWYMNNLGGQVERDSFQQERLYERRGRNCVMSVHEAVNLTPETLTDGSLKSITANYAVQGNLKGNLVYRHSVLSAVITPRAQPTIVTVP